MKKKVIIIISIMALLAIAGLVSFFLFFKKDGYRLLKVFEVEGDANVNRDSIGDIDPYNNMVLENGDRVSLKTGIMNLLADEDKYIYMEEGTELVLNATGTSENSKTVIELLSGAITNDIKNKLSEESSYEVNTPNATMSVRGTIFRVEVYEKDGVKYTKLSVFEGKVVSRLKNKDGSYSKNEVEVNKGKEVIIYEDDQKVAYLSDPTDIDYTELPDSVLDLLKKSVNEGRDVDYSKDNDDDAFNEPVTVTFMYGGNVFGSQTVEKGSRATRPTLSPAVSGDWDWNFGDPVEEDITVDWK